MITAAEAEQIILSAAKDFGTAAVPLEHALRRVSAEPIIADRDLPPYNRVTMDGIAIKYDAFEKGHRTFLITGTQPAGAEPIEIKELNECVEIMTGAALPITTDTIIRYEDLIMADGYATITIDNIRKGQNVHYKGKDERQGAVLAEANQVITPAIINIAASVGMSHIQVLVLPKVVIISTGDEVIPVSVTPTPFEVRSSNSYAMKAILQEHGIAADTLHIVDDEEQIRKSLSGCLEQYDVLLMSGGVSMGKYDYLPKILHELQVEERFHKVKQRPGKPLWFGVSTDNKVVFAFPGNPVSTFMCTYRYFITWLYKSLGVKEQRPLYAILDTDYSFQPELQYFLQVKTTCSQDGKLLATPAEGNGSGDFANLLHTDAFMELPAEQTNFKKGEAYRIWPYKNIL